MKVALISAPSAWAEPVHAPRQPHLAALTAALENIGHTVITQDPPRTRTALADLLRHEDPDVVHLDSSAGGVADLVADAARRGRVPLVYRLGREPAAAPPPGVTAASHVLVSHTGQERRLRAWGVPRTRLSLIPHGVDLAHFTPEGPRVARRLPHRVVAVGRLTPASGFGTVVGALVALPHTELVIAGGPRTGRHARQLRAYAASLGVADRVRLAGPVPRAELPTLLRSADVMVCGPWEPSFHVAALEAMACGVAVVANGMGGLADTVVDDITGTQVPPRRPRAVAATLARMVRHKIVWEHQGAAGRDRAGARYSWTQIARETTRAYERAVATGG